MEIVSLLEVGEWLFNKIRPRKVLLAVEDNKIDALHLREELDLCKMKYEIVSSAEEALGMLRTIRFAAAIIDIGLPQMDGNTLATRIRDDHPKMRIFFVTGSSFINLTEGQLLRVVRKPITAHALREMVI